MCLGVLLMLITDVFVFLYFARKRKRMAFVCSMQIRCRLECASLRLICVSFSYFCVTLRFLCHSLGVVLHF